MHLFLPIVTVLSILAIFSVLFFLTVLKYKKNIDQLSITIEEKEAELISQRRQIIGLRDKLEKIRSYLIEDDYLDYLTKLGNNDKWKLETAKIREELGRKKPLLLYIDIDNLKYFNDTFGHPLGDAIIMRVALILKKIISRSNFLFRFDSDEYLLLFPNATFKKGEELALKIIDEVSHEDFSPLIRELAENDKVVIPEKEIGCSIGIARWTKDADFNFYQLLDDAKSAMFEAKALGKSQFFIGK